jgi:hypothetical protein
MLKSDKEPTYVAPPDKSLLFVIRYGCNGGIVRFINFIDKRFIGETACNTYFSTIVEPGTHTLKTIDNHCTLELTNYEEQIDFIAGKTYFMLQRITGYGDAGYSNVTTSVIQGATGGPAHMVGTLMTEKDIADEYIKKCKYLVRENDGVEPTILNICK